MDPFEAWVQTAPYSCVQRYKEELLKLGANFDSFKREASEVVEDLVSGGIPRMAARDVYGAVAETIAKRGVPMAVFWDLENLPVPSSCSGRYVASRLKSVLTDHGDLVEFRGYASIGLNNIPEEKRSDLQLSGCHLVDCPHNGRKEVADKMIIVDAMDFVNDRPNGAVLCFITGDTDYAYLLSKLQRRPNCRTIVISKGTAESMLHVSCTVKLRWETDVLQLVEYPVKVVEAPVKPVASNATGVPPGFPSQVVKSTVEPTPVPKSYALAATSLVSATAAFPVVSAPSTTTALASGPSGSNQEFSLEECKEMIRNAFSCAPDGARIESGCLKSSVGGFLKQSYPMRFPGRQVVKDFLAFAIDSGVVLESGKAVKVLTLPGTASLANIRYSSPVFESTLPPIPFARMPKRALEVASMSPFVIFIHWALCPCKSMLPKGTYVQSYEYMAILMYSSKLRKVGRARLGFCPIPRPFPTRTSITQWGSTLRSAHNLLVRSPTISLF
jgi:NYN domain